MYLINFGLMGIFSSIIVWASPQINCDQVSDSVSWRFCVSKEPNSLNPNILYFFHGSFGDENRWFDGKVYRELTKFWSNSKFDQPTIVTISYGSVWALLESAPNPQSQRLDHFLNQAVPYIESRYPFSGKRFIVGESMGSYNALQIYFRRPQFAAKIVSLCPAIWTISPWSSFKDIFTYHEETNASVFKILEMFAVVKWGFSNLETWNSGDPLLLSEKINSARPPLYLSRNRDDSFGLFNAIGTFYQKELPNNKALQLEDAPGDHCSAFDYSRVTKFLEDEGK